MSAPGAMIPFVSAPWFDADGIPLSVRPLPGLRPEVIQSLECSYPGILTPAMKALLGTCCGLAGTALGSIDFTGCWFLEEPCAVFRPALTLAIDDAERRWIAEIGDGTLPGPVWCVFSDPEVAVHVSDDLANFMATIRAHTARGAMKAWLHSLTAQARAVWSRRHTLAMRPHEAAHTRRAIRGGCRGSRSMPMYMICASQELCAAGRTEWQAPRVDCIVVEGCPCSRLLDCRQKAGGRRGHRFRLVKSH